MYQILFRTDTIIVYSSYVMMALAAMGAVALIDREARWTGADLMKVYPMLFVLYFSALFGGHGLRCLFGSSNPDPLCLLAFWKGDMTFYGGFFLAGAAFVVYARAKRMGVLATADLLVPGVALFLALYRVGCFLNGCCWGKVTDLPWAVTFPMHEGARHPTQLYESLNALVLLGLVTWLRRRKRFEGQFAVIFLACYPAARFLIELFRDDPRRFVQVCGLRLSEAQAAGIPVLLCSMLLYLVGRKRSGRSTCTRGPGGRHPLAG